MSLGAGARSRCEGCACLRAPVEVGLCRPHRQSSVTESCGGGRREAVGQLVTHAGGSMLPHVLLYLGGGGDRSTAPHLGLPWWPCRLHLSLG